MEPITILKEKDFLNLINQFWRTYQLLSVYSVMGSHRAEFTVF